MRGGQAPDSTVAFLRRRHLNSPPVARIHGTGDEAERFQPVYQAHRAVMVHVQTLGQVADTQGAAIPLQGEKGLVLPRGQPGRLCRGLAEVQKACERVPEGGQVFEFSRGHGRVAGQRAVLRGRHIYRVTIYPIEPAREG